MEMLLSRLLRSKQMQKFGVGAGAVFLVIYLVPITYRKWAIGLACGAFLVMAFYHVFLKGLGKRKVAAFEKGLVKDASAKPKSGKMASRKAQAEISSRFKDAVDVLKRGKLDIYSMPWYMLIGEPQSGKTTTLRNSGLEFPVGTEALSGAGGTRNCDWWFTTECVFLDTAGRFTFQEKDAPDTAEWKAFLKLLKKNRPRCPINGVVLVLPCTSILGDSDEEVEAKATNIREKLSELQQQLEVQFPVFVVITKSDQILGFTEFFSRIPGREQRQILGWSVPGPFIQAFDPDKINEHFDSVADRIDKLRLEIMSEDLRLNEIDKLFVLPDEFRAVREPLKNYLKAIFVQSPYLPPLFFRGFYFTSGLQEGKPIAKACAALMRDDSSDGGSELIENLAQAFARSKAFFIRDFYTDKLFKERDMVIHSVGRMKIARRLGFAAVAASVLFVMATGLFMGWKFMELRKGIGKISDVTQVIKKDFIRTAQNNRDLSESDMAHPPPFKSTAESIENSNLLSEAIESTADQNLGLDNELRDMHWLYFLQNVLYQQGRTAYAMAQSSGAGASSSELMNQYVRLWSVDHAWSERTRDGKGDFSGAQRLAWGALLAENPEDFDIAKLQGKFDKELNLTIADLGTELDFTDNVDPDSTNPPISLRLAPGKITPASNLLIERELSALEDSLRPPPAAIIDQIVADANNAQKSLDRYWKDLVSAECGYRNSSADPFDISIDALERIYEEFSHLQALLDENGSAMGNFNVDIEAIRAKFEELRWKQEAAETPAESELNALFDERVRAAYRRLDQSARDARLPLEKVREIVAAEEEALALTAGSQYLLSGLDRFRAYARAQNTRVHNMKQNPMEDRDEVLVIGRKWRGSPERTAALEWAELALQEEGLSRAWQQRVRDLAKLLKRSVRNGDRSIELEALLRYISLASPKVALSDDEIKNASFASESAAGARSERLEDMARETKGLEKTLRDFRLNAEVECSITEARIKTEVQTLQKLVDRNNRNFEEYWSTAYENWDPASWISGPQTWEQFKKLDLFEGPMLASRARRELREFVANLRHYQDWSDLPTDLESDYRDISPMAEAGSPLELGCNNFVEAVGGLSKFGKPEAFGRLDQEFKDGRTYREKLYSISKNSSALNQKFLPFPKRVVQLLDVSREFELALADFLCHWSKELGGRFPFEIDKTEVSFDSSSGANRGKTVARIPQAKAVALRDFFVGEDGLDDFMATWGSIYGSWSQRDENRRLREFVNELAAIRELFFDGKQFRQFEIHGTFTGFDDAQSGANLQEFSEDLVLSVPGSDPSRYRTRIEGGEDDFTWRPGDYPEKDAFRFDSFLGRGALRKQNTTTLQIPGDFSVLAYLYAMGSLSDTRNRFDVVTFRVQPRRAETGTKYFGVTFDFELARSLPELPDWKSVQRWTCKQ